MTLELARMPSPVGDLVIAVREGRVCVLTFAHHWERAEARLRKRLAAVELRPSPDPGGVVTRLARYFSGDLGALEAIAVDMDGTAFQLRVWEQLRRIPAGRTASYGEVARAIGAPSAVRAVGAANGANPVAIVVPCHRVIGAGGALTGYGGGMERKRWLLAHEGAQQELRVA